MLKHSKRFSRKKRSKGYISRYKKKSENNILLINSWNEWGENMAIEPGNLLNDNYLLLLKMNLLQYLSSYNNIDVI